MPPKFWGGHSLKRYAPKKVKVKKVNLYSAFVVPHTQGAQMRIT